MASSIPLPRDDAPRDDAPRDDPGSEGHQRGGTPGAAAVVTVTHGRHHELERLHQALSAARRPPRELVVVALQDEELISWAPEEGVPVQVMPMSAAPQGISWAAAKNAGATAALRHGAEVVVFVEPTAELGAEAVAALEEAATRADGVWWAVPADGQETPDAPDAAAPEHLHSSAFAVSLGAWAELGGFCEDYVGSGYEDLDLARAAQAAGLRLGPAPAAVVRRSGGADRDHAALARNAELHRSRWGIRPDGLGGGW